MDSLKLLCFKYFDCLYLKKTAKGMMNSNQMVIKELLSYILFFILNNFTSATYSLYLYLFVFYCLLSYVREIMIHRTSGPKCVPSSRPNSWPLKILKLFIVLGFGHADSCYILSRLNDEHTKKRLNNIFFLIKNLRFANY